MKKNGRFEEMLLVDGLGGIARERKEQRALTGGPCSGRRGRCCGGVQLMWLVGSSKGGRQLAMPGSDWLRKGDMICYDFHGLINF